MKKIRLNVDELEVRSFDTEAAPEPRGTVRGREYSLNEFSCHPDQGCFWGTQEWDNCAATNATCGASCDWACDSYQTCPADTSCCG
jgi:hypothetical protein